MLSQPLASLLRPKTLKDFVGQTHLVGPQKPLRLAIENHQIFSMIFWGPPGVGKTTLARILAKEAEATIYELSAVSASKDDIKKIIANSRPLEKTVLFLDEIHRFNKAQQDFLLPSVESGALILIGATTENPSFEVIAPLLSRCRIFVLKELSEDEISQIITHAIKKLNKDALPAIVLTKAGRDWLISMANGDARQCITIMDNAVTLYGDLKLESLKQALQNSFLRFDKKGEEHYNTISAFIKSMRASNVDAAIYYLARMIAAGEDPKFIARRMVIFSSEDIGTANSSALLVANAVFRSVEIIGYPECRINLAHGVVYLAKSPKNRSCYDAVGSALKEIEMSGNLPIPLNLRNPVTKLMDEIGYGKGYDLPANASHQAMQAGKYSKEDLLPDKLKGKKFFIDIIKK